MGKLSGKIAVITGGSTGIGLATAKRFVKEGAHVFITGRRQVELDAAVRAIGDNVTGVQGDVAKLEDLDRLYATVKQQKGRIDVLFANAGGGEFAPLAAVTEAHFDWIFDGNVKGMLFTVQKALPLMPDGAAIILTSSVVGSKGLGANSVYAATKAVARSFARTWANELKGRGIRVNSITPGPIDTPGITGLAPDEEQAAGLKSFLATQVPLGRMGRPDEIADAVLFLATDSSSFITGANLDVDGGMNQI